LAKSAKQSDLRRANYAYEAVMKRIVSVPLSAAAATPAVGESHGHDLRRPAAVSNSPTIQELPKSVPEGTCWVLVVLLLAVSFAALYLLWAKTTGTWPFPQF